MLYLFLGQIIIALSSMKSRMGNQALYIGLMILDNVPLTAEVQ